MYLGAYKVGNSNSKHKYVTHLARRLNIYSIIQSLCQIRRTSTLETQAVLFKSRGPFTKFAVFFFLIYQNSSQNVSTKMGTKTQLTKFFFNLKTTSDEKIFAMQSDYSENKIFHAKILHDKRLLILTKN